MAHLSSGMFALFNVIFLIIFVTADQKNGYIKNIGGQVKRRYRLIVAKWVAAAVYVLVFDAIMFATQAVALVATQGYLHWGSHRHICRALVFRCFCSMLFWLCA